jgi:hypothetical protein
MCNKQKLPNIKRILGLNSNDTPAAIQDDRPKLAGLSFSPVEVHLITQREGVMNSCRHNKIPDQKKCIVFNGEIISVDDLRKAKSWYKFEINNCTVFNGDIVSIDDLRDTNQIIKRKSFLVWLKLLIKEAQQCLK